MKKHRGLWLGLGLAALLGLSGSPAQAGTLTMVLTWGSNSLTITSGSPYATYTADSNGVESLTVTNLTLLNNYLTSHGSNLTFQGNVGVSDNIPSATQSSGATLTSGGQVNLTGTSATGADSITITAYQSDFTVPTGMKGVLSSSGTANFTNTNIGDSEVSQSWYNSNNTPGAMQLPSGTTTITSNNTTTNSGTSVPPSGTQTATITSYVVPFSLTNQVMVSLTPTGKSGESAQYGVSTLVTATSVPEPASLVLMVTAMPVPLVFMSMFRRRKASKS